MWKRHALESRKKTALCFPTRHAENRLEIMRKAFTDTIKDTEFLAEAKKANLDINPTDGAELERNVKEVFNLEPGATAQSQRDSQVVLRTSQM